LGSENDPVELAVPALADVAISFYVPNQVIHSETYHALGLQTNYVATGDVAGAATLSEQKDLMGHSSISTTLNVYGGTSLTQMRPLVETVADLLQPKQP